ncbi:hypothetical protein D3C80_830930 [compost metagenome]
MYPPGAWYFLLNHSLTIVITIGVYKIIKDIIGHTFAETGSTDGRWDHVAQIAKVIVHIIGGQCFGGTLLIFVKGALQHHPACFVLELFNSTMLQVSRFPVFVLRDGFIQLACIVIGSSRGTVSSQFPEFYLCCSIGTVFSLYGIAQTGCFTCCIFQYPKSFTRSALFGHAV